MFRNTAEENMVKQMKEKACYVADDLEVEFMKASCAVDMDTQYKLHDGQVVTIGMQTLSPNSEYDDMMDQ